MQLAAPHPFRAALCRWTTQGGALYATLICKASFEVVPGELRPTEPDALNELDGYIDDDRSRSIYFPSDMVPFKAGVDVVLSGHAFAPGGTPVRSLIARLGLGSVSKAIEVHGDRALGPDGRLRNAAFAAMFLGYERAAGGPGTSNPIGVAPGGRDNRGYVKLPNLQPVGARAEPGMHPPPIGFGPIPPGWPSRRERIGALAAALEAGAWLRSPIPDDLDPTCFNCAPDDQRLEVFAGDEPISLENLHREHPLLRARFCGVRPRGFVGRSDSGLEEIDMRADTIWFDTDRGVCAITWRGTARLQRVDEFLEARVLTEDPSAARRATIDRAGPNAPRKSTVPLAPRPVADDRTVASSGEDVEDREPAWMRSGVHSKAPPRGPEAPPHPANSAPSMRPAAPEYAVSAASAAPAPHVQPTPRQPSSAALPEFRSTPPPMPSVPPPRVVAPQAPARPPPAIAPPAPLPPPPAPAPVTGAAVVSAVAASNAAAGLVEPTAGRRRLAVPKPPASAGEGGAPVALLWLDAKEVARARKHDRFRPVFAARRIPEGDGESGRAEKPKHEARVLLRHAAETDVDALQLEADHALTDGDGSAPLAVVAGEMELLFESVSMLRAAIALAGAHAAASKRLKDAIDSANETLAAPGVERATVVLDRAFARLREAFSQEVRPSPANYLEANIESMVLDERAFRRRTLLGGKHVVTLLHPLGARPGTTVPLYLPEDAEPSLPLFARLQVRALVEAHPRVDQGEASTLALRALALGRVVARRR